MAAPSRHKSLRHLCAGALHTHLNRLVIVSQSLRNLSAYFCHRTAVAALSHHDHFAIAEQLLCSLLLRHRCAVAAQSLCKRIMITFFWSFIARSLG
jgi:hypothetical protein